MSFFWPNHPPTEIHPFPKLQSVHPQTIMHSSHSFAIFCPQQLKEGKKAKGNGRCRENDFPCHFNCLVQNSKVSYKEPWPQSLDRSPQYKQAQNSQYQYQYHSSQDQNQGQNFQKEEVEPRPRAGRGCVNIKCQTKIPNIDITNIPISQFQFPKPVSEFPLNWYGAPPQSFKRKHQYQVLFGHFQYPKYQNSNITITQYPNIKTRTDCKVWGKTMWSPAPECPGANIKSKVKQDNTSCCSSCCCCFSTLSRKWTWFNLVRFPRSCGKCQF